LIRHPEGLERTGFRFSPEWQFWLNGQFINRI